MAEEFIHLRKSKPVMIAAGVIWGMIGWYYTQHGMSELAESAVRHNFLEFAELMLFLLVAMTYVNAMEERRVFDALRSWLVNKGFGFRALFWLTGILSFFISPIADNLTTALLMCAIVPDKLFTPAFLYTTDTVGNLLDGQHPSTFLTLYTKHYSHLICLWIVA